MNPWPFVIAAYAVAAIGAGGIALITYRAMRSAERAADALRNRA